MTTPTTKILYSLDGSEFQEYIPGTTTITINSNTTLVVTARQDYGEFTSQAISGEFAIPIFSEPVIKNYVLGSGTMSAVENLNAAFNVAEGRIEISWTKDPGDSITTKYAVFYGTASTTWNGTGLKPNFPEAQSVASPMETTSTFVNLYGWTNGAPYWFKVAPMDAQNNVGPETVLNFNITPSMSLGGGLSAPNIQSIQIGTGVEITINWDPA